ncbi:winged helix-turn-helix domain-containing protein [Methanococcoides seepicolus]|uniref:Helix-turn-helix transcriptional regulator n=1 Tax=Methanococcoides seepicolus TaxID=2828780 RepID=A0A9E4ZHR6_9EURY|nr:helix-turn-helix domain-containing protein [Methanococcoides seepicolus]MCM1987755.1 helix-turn-helix transcriptional regulator [Methanococcoides seepicolus]
MTTNETESIEKYANEMPSELRRAMKALGGNTGLATFLVLFKYGELSFSEIRKELEIPTELSGQLTYHIKNLQKAGLVKNEYVKKEDTNNFSFYDVTEFGEDFVNNLMTTVKVLKPEQVTLEVVKTVEVASNLIPNQDKYRVENGHLNKTISIMGV